MSDLPNKSCLQKEKRKGLCVSFAPDTKKEEVVEGPPPGPCKRAVGVVAEEALGTEFLRDLLGQWKSFVPFWERDSRTLTAFFALHRSIIEEFVVKVFEKRYNEEYADSHCERVVLTSFWERVYARMTVNPDDIRLSVISVQAHVRGWRVRLLLSREKTWNLLLTEGL